MLRLLFSVNTVLTQGLDESLGYFAVSLIPIKSVIKNMIQRTNNPSSLLHLPCNPTPSLKSFYPFTSSANRPVNYTRQFTCLDSENKWNYCYFCIKRCAVNPKRRTTICVRVGGLLMQSLATTPPVVTNLQQKCGMKQEKTNCVDNSLVQVTVKY